MKSTTKLIVASLCLPASLAFLQPRDSIRFAPDAGATVTKSFTYTMELTLDDMAMLMNGEDPGAMMPEVETESKTVGKIVVTDEYVAVKAGMPVKLKRTFDEIDFTVANDVSMDMMGTALDANMHGTGTSPLSGLTIEFAWDEEEGEYKKSIVDGEGDEDDLSGLSENMDLRVFLPEGDVSEGDEWDVDLDGLGAIMFPGGSLGIEVESDGDEPPQGMPDPSTNPHPVEMIGEVIDGSATAKYLGTRDAGGVSVAAIEIKLEIESARDMSELYRDLMAEVVPEGVEMSLDRADNEFELDAEGELLWNLKTGHAHSFQLKGDISILTEQEMNMGAAGQSFEIEQTVELSGTFECSLSTE